MKKIKDKIKSLVHFVLHGVFELNIETRSSIARFFIRLLKTIVISIRNFSTYAISIKASALTYYSILAIVPIFALFLAIAGGFGFKEYMHKFVSSMVGDSELVPIMLGFVDNYLAQVKGGWLIGVGVFMLLWAAISMFRHIEDNFNRIWNVKKNRSIVRQITTYITILILVPILIVLSNSAAVYFDVMMSSIAQKYVLGGVVYSFYRVSLLLLPYFIYWLLFSLIFIIIPNTKVKIQHGIIAGVISGTAVRLLQIVYLSGVVSLSQYNAVYGSFAAIPMSLFWLQITWLIVLYGAEVSYIGQNLDNFYYDSETDDISLSDEIYMSLLILKCIVSAFCKKQSAPTASRIAAQYNIPIRLTLRYLKKLTNAGMICEVVTEANSESGFVPAFDTNQITVGDSLNQLLSIGTHNLHLNDENGDTLKATLRAIKEDIASKTNEMLLKEL